MAKWRNGRDLPETIESEEDRGRDAPPELIKQITKHETLDLWDSARSEDGALAWFWPLIEPLAQLSNDLHCPVNATTHGGRRRW